MPLDAEAENSLLRRILATVSRPLQLGELARRLAELTTEITGTDVCFVHSVDAETGRLTLVGATPPFDAVAGTITLESGEGIAGWVAAHGEPIVVPDKWRDARYKYIAALHGEEFVSLVSVPMRGRDGRVLGVLNVHSRSARQFAEPDVGLLTHVADLVAGVIENARLYTRLAEREAELEVFARRTLELQEAERARVALDIHDGVSQRLVGLAYRLSAATGAPGTLDPGVAAHIAAARELAVLALDETRGAIRGLRPPLLDDLGIAACLRALGGELPESMSVAVDAEDVRLPSHVETALYRIAQEALQNVVKHAGAGHVEMTLTMGPSCARMVVVDDGRGFDPAAPLRRGGGEGSGLAGMRSRAELLGGVVMVRSAPGSGTEIAVEIPSPV